jgi:hypothetical protein
MLLPLAASLSACASVALTEGGSLSSYSNLGKETGKLAKSRTFVDPSITRAKTVRIMPTSFSAKAEQQVSKPEDKALVSRALDRTICIALSDKYEIVPADKPADITIHNVVTNILPTNKAAAGVSTAVSLGTSFVLPVGVPRLPVGLGGLAVEGEAVDPSGRQQAAILWARGANSISNSPRISEVGDAYALAASYGDDFSSLIIKGKAPSMMDVSMPSSQKIKSFFGGKPKYEACDTFGRQPGISGMVAGAAGAPPEWTDKPKK